MKTSKTITQHNGNGFGIRLLINADGTIRNANVVQLYGEDRVEYTHNQYINNRERISTCQKQRRIDDPEYYKEYLKIWNLNNPENARKHRHKARAIRQGWDAPVSLNKHFEGSHLHHLHLINYETGEYNHTVSIYIPTELHKSIWHTWHDRKSMLKINKSAFKFLYTQI